MNVKYMYAKNGKTAEKVASDKQATLLAGVFMSASARAGISGENRGAMALAVGTLLTMPAIATHDGMALVSVVIDSDESIITIDTSNIMAVSKAIASAWAESEKMRLATQPQESLYDSCRQVVRKVAKVKKTVAQKTAESYLEGLV
jgi:hypothetical protein